MVRNQFILIEWYSHPTLQHSSWSATPEPCQSSPRRKYIEMSTSPRSACSRVLIELWAMSFEFFVLPVPTTYEIWSLWRWVFSLRTSSQVCLKIGGPRDSNSLDIAPNCLWQCSICDFVSVYSLLAVDSWILQNNPWHKTEATFRYYRQQNSFRKSSAMMMLDKGVCLETLFSNYVWQTCLGQTSVVELNAFLPWLLPM